MRILLTGAKGQLGRHLSERLQGADDLIEVDRARCDLANAAAVSALLDATHPDWIINAAAMTGVDEAETASAEADQLNHRLPEQLAHWAKVHSARLLHYSTDYVFSGTGDAPWKETDAPAPQSVYGITKRRGEEAVVASGASAYIVRTAWVYSALRGNFLSAILGKAAQGQALRVVNDQIGSPTWAGSLAHATTSLLARPPEMEVGCTLLHVVNREAMSWFELAQRAVNKAVELGVLDRPVDVMPVSSDEWPQIAPRPAFSVLDPSKYETLTGQEMASVDEALDACLANWSQWQC